MDFLNMNTLAIMNLELRQMPQVDQGTTPTNGVQIVIPISNQVLRVTHT